jgi:uncharacterized protein
LLVVASVQVLAQHTIESVPNQRLIDGSHVSSPDGILSREAIAAIDSLLIDIENRTTAQVAVVAVESIGEADIFDFAQELFNTWGIGHSNDNGLLILLVTDQRTIRFHTGTSMEVVMTDVTGKRIQRDYMLPSFKEGDYEAGMIAGVQRVHELLTNPSKAADLEYTDNTPEMSGFAAILIFIAFFYLVPLIVIFAIKSGNGEFSNSKIPSKTLYKEMPLTRGRWLVVYGLIPLLIVVAFWPAPDDLAGFSLFLLYFYFMLTLVYRLYRERQVLNRFVEHSMYFEATEFIKSTQWFWFFMALIFPIPFFLYFFFHLTRKSHYRHHPRNCELCKAKMRELNERDDDQYLTEKQRFEEELRSVDYDVWQCTACSATREFSYVSKRRKYVECPRCRTKAKYLKSRNTIESATYSRSGSGKETHECKFCKETFVSTYTIAQLVRSQSSGSSFSSGSSSSGSSWGGGRSSGGGSSSSW